MRLQPDNAVVYMQAAELCYEHLDMVRDLIVMRDTQCNIGTSRY